MEVWVLEHRECFLRSYKGKEHVTPLMCHQLTGRKDTPPRRYHDKLGRTNQTR